MNARVVYLPSDHMPQLKQIMPHIINSQKYTRKKKSPNNLVNES